MKRIAAASLLLFACARPSAPTAHVQTTTTTTTTPAATLLPRSVIFAGAEHGAPQLSPDKRWLLFHAPHQGISRFMLAALGSPLDLANAKPILDNLTRPLAWIGWSYLPDTILFMRDQDGDENTHILALDVTTGATRDLTPFPKTQALFVQSSARRPGDLLVTMNDRDPKAADLYRVAIATGKRTLLRRGDDFDSFIADDDLVPRLAHRSEADGSETYLEKGKSGAFDRVFLKIPFEDNQTTSLEGFDDTGRTVYLLDSRGRNTRGVFALDVATKQETLLADDARADTAIALTDPVTHRPLLATSDFDRPRYRIIDERVRPDVEVLGKLGGRGMARLDSCTPDLALCTISAFDGVSPPGFYLYDRTAKKVDYLFSLTSKLEHVALAQTRPFVIPARDGLELVSYLTLPPGTPEHHPLPMVLDVHGGPWARDTWGLLPDHQWLASRGYAVLSVNFRGSTGFGKAFTNAGDREWGAKMQDDLSDAVAWATRAGIADAKRIAIYGGSYGGYAALVGLTKTPDTFACAVDEVGPSNLETLEASFPAQWDSQREDIYRRIGDPRTEAGRTLLHDRSPLWHVGGMQRPLLIAQGMNDPRVKPAESEQIVAAMKAKKIPVTYITFRDEGHGFHRPANDLAFRATAEQFLAACLGGAAEPIGDALTGSSLEAVEGAGLVHGLTEAIARNAKQ